MESFEYAKQLVRDFVIAEYGLDDEDTEDLFDDMEHISLAYTTHEDTGQEIQSELDLVNFKITTYLDGKIKLKLKYNTLQELIKNELEYLDFDELIRI